MWVVRLLWAWTRGQYLDLHPRKGPTGAEVGRLTCACCVGVLGRQAGF